MVEEIISGGRLVALVTDLSKSYVDGLTEAKKLARDNEHLSIASMPEVIQLMDSYPEVREVGREGNLNAYTTEVLGMRADVLLSEGRQKRWQYPRASHELVHGMVPEVGLRRLNDSTVINFIDKKLWHSFGGIDYLTNGDEKFIRRHVTEIREPYFTPEEGAVYAIFSPEREDYASEKDELDRKEFGENKLVDMRAGSSQKTKQLERILFDPKELGGEGLDSVYVNHPLYSARKHPETFKELLSHQMKHGNDVDMIKDARPHAIAQGVYLDVGNGRMGSGFLPGGFVLRSNGSGYQRRMFSEESIRDIEDMSLTREDKNFLTELVSK